MDLIKIAGMLKGVGLGNVVVIGVVLLSLIQITPLKLNPWSHFFKWVGKLINGEVMESIKGIQKDLEGVHEELDQMKSTEKRREAINCRNRILRFDDELRRKVDHSEEFFTQILEDVTTYRSYCESHKSFPNARADSAMRNIEETYSQCRKDNKFI